MEVVKCFWGVFGEVEELFGDRDWNFRVGVGFDLFVFKVMDVCVEELGLVMEVLEWLGEVGGFFIVGRSFFIFMGDILVEIVGVDGWLYWIWVVCWVDGVLLVYVGKWVFGLLGEIGIELGCVCRLFDGWEYFVFDCGLKWDFCCGLEVVWELELFVQD